MKIFNNIKEIIFAIIFLLLIVCTPLSADEKVLFESEEQYQDFLSQTSKTWKCDWKDQHPSTAKGTKTYIRPDGNTLKK